MAKLDQKQERLWATLCHLGGFGGFIFGIGSIVVPLILWLIKKDESAFVDDQGKEALNFQISMAIFALAAGLLIVLGIGIVLVIAVALVDIAFMIIASIKANNGEKYRYPINLRLVK